MKSNENEFEIKYISVDNIAPNPKNRNKHSQDQIEFLAKIIESVGFRVPLIVSSTSGYLVKGHGSLAAAKKIGIEQVPVIYQEFADSKIEYQFMVADNEIARWSELDVLGFKADLDELELDFEPSEFGLKYDVLSNLDDIKIDEPKDTDKPKNQDIIECPECGFEIG